MAGNQPRKNAKKTKRAVSISVFLAFFRGQASWASFFIRVIIAIGC